MTGLASDEKGRNKIRNGVRGMMATRFAAATLLAMGLAGVGAAQSVRGGEEAGAVAPRPQDSSSAGLTPAGHSEAEAPSTPSADVGEGHPAAEDAGLPNAPQAKTTKVKGYERPTEKIKLVNYLFDAYGPFPIVGSALVAGINQADGSVKEWGGGIGGYGRRWGSNFGIGAITTTTRYGMAEMLREDTLYYRCQCTGFFPRLSHALISTFTGRRGEDGHRVFSVPSLVAPYVGEMVAVYAWYPARYDAMDAFRQGNYSLLAYAGGNVALEFFPSGPHSLLTRMHLQNRHGAQGDSN